MTALESVSKGYYDYMGFVFNDNGIVGIDIDDGYDEDGFISDEALDIINTVHSYTEISKSGRGFHIIVAGNLPFLGRNNRQGIEIYKKARFFVMTGNIVNDNPMIANQEAIDYVVAKYFADTPIESEGKGLRTQRIYEPTWATPSKTITIQPTYPPIPKGTRNISLISLAGQLRSQGLDNQQVWEKLQEVNKTCCQPPLDEGELKTIFRSVSRYK